MAIKFSNISTKAQKPQVQAQVQATPAIATIEQMKAIVAPQDHSTVLAQEYLTLHKMMLDMEGYKIQERLDAIKSELQSIANQGNPDDQAEFSTPLGTLVFGPRTNTLKPKSNEEVLSVLPADVALKVCKFGVTELKKYLSPAELEAATVKERGARSLKSIILK